MTPLLGTDISSHNFATGLPVKLAKLLKTRGVTFVIARASIGLSTDRAFVTSIGRARDAGLEVGAYHYLTDGASGQKQADVFRGQLAKVGGYRDIIIANDLENDSSGGIPSRDQVRDWAREMNEAIGNNAQLQLYSRRSIAATMGNPDFTNLYDHFWQAYYTDRLHLSRYTTPSGVKKQPDPISSLPNAAPSPRGAFGFRTAPMWQFGPLYITSPSGSKLALDGDAFYGTIDDLHGWMKPRIVPLEERPNYAVGRRAALDYAISLVKAMPKGDAAPHLPSGPAAPAGWDAGLEDILGELSDMSPK